MKNLLFTLLLFATFALQAQVVEPIQRSLITKRTATWCTFCGTWGWDFFEETIEDNEGKAFFFGAHYSGDLETTIAQDITANFGAAGQPQFFFNETNINASSSTVDTKLSEMKMMVDDAFETMPVAGVGLEVYWDSENEQILVNTNTKFFQNTTGEYYTAVYLVEDGVVNFQQSQGSNAVHKNVLRASFTDNTWGLGFDIGAFGAEEEYPNMFTMSGIENPLISNLDYEYVAVIWLKVGDQYSVVNVNGTKEISELVVDNVTEITTDGVGVYPSVFTNQINVNFDLTSAVKEARFTIVDVAGKQVYEQKTGGLSTGKQLLTLDVMDLTEKGAYFLTINLDGYTLTKKLIRN